MRLVSSDFQAGEMLPSRLTCDGEGVSPQLSWEDMPAGAQSFALRCFDPDAPGGGFVHWLIVDIPADARAIPAGGPLPMGARELENDYGQTPYGLPCPPSGAHRYEFTLYALDVPTLPNITPASFFSEASAHALATATLMGRYQRRGR